MPERGRKAERKTVGSVATAAFLLAALCFVIAGGAFLIRYGDLLLVALCAGCGMLVLALVAAVVGAVAGRDKKGTGKGAAANHDDTTSTTSGKEGG